MKDNILSKGATPVALIIAIIVIAGAIWYLGVYSVPTEETGEELMEKEMVGVPEGAVSKTPYMGMLLAGNTSPLLEFTQTDYEKALQSDKLVVLYFFADWCPICKKEFPLMQEAFNELSTDEVIGFRVNFNDRKTTKEERELAREFGVMYQHTKIFIKDKEGILKAPDSWDTPRYLSEIRRVLSL